jgi:hypothetical protein
MSFVKWCDTQHALPRSAIFTLIMGPLLFLFFLSLDEELDAPPDLSSEMPETSLVRMSLSRVSWIAKCTLNDGLTQSSLAVLR